MTVGMLDEGVNAPVWLTWDFHCDVLVYIMALVPVYGLSST